MPRREPIELPGATIAALRADAADPMLIRVMIGGRIGARVSRQTAQDLELKVGLVLDTTIAERLADESRRVDGRRRALSWLGRRAMPRRAVERKLRRLGLETADIEALTTELTEAGFIDDTAYAEAYTSTRLRRGGVGSRRLLADLAAKGIDRDTAARVVAEATADRDETGEAEQVALQRLARPSVAALDGPTKYRRLAGFLQRRGFSPDACREGLRRALARAEAD